MPSFKRDLISHKPVSNLRTIGIPMGQPYYTVLISSPIIFFDSEGNARNQSLTGSVLLWHLKNRTEKNGASGLDYISLLCKAFFYFFIFR